MFRTQDQETFYNTIKLHHAKLDDPLLLEGGTGLGKTRAYLKALQEFDGTVAIVLPSHQLIDQLLQSADVAAVGVEPKPFRPASFFETQDDYLAANQEAKDAKLMVCTSASVMIDQMLSGGYNGVTERDYILFDEADSLPQDAALRQDLTIFSSEIRSEGIAQSKTKDMLTELISNAESYETRAKAKLILEAHNKPRPFYTVGQTDDGDIVLHHQLPGRLLKKISNQGNTAFISATLSIANRFDDFKRSMGISGQSIYSSQIDPTHHGELNVQYPIADPIEEVIKAAQKPCLVVTPSHADADDLASLLPGAVKRECEETSVEAAARVSEDGILIATAAWAGLDTPLQWASVVVPRIPFGVPTELDDEKLTHYISSRNLAMRRMRQVVGRGLRRPDSKCDFYICDKRYSQLGNFLPARFTKSWKEGAKKEVTLSKAERSTEIRREAFKHYEKKCYCCEKKPKFDSMLQIHHLDPIAEGERKTEIEDVIPLCATCHIAAHTENPPIPIDRLREMELWEA